MTTCGFPALFMSAFYKSICSVCMCVCERWHNDVSMGNSYITKNRLTAKLLDFCYLRVTGHIQDLQLNL